MTVAVATASIVAFLIAFWLTKVVAAATKAIGTTTEVMQILTNDQLDDDAKEAASRKGAISLLGSVVSIAVRSVVSILVAGIPILLAQALGLVSAQTVIDFLSRWDVIVISSAIILVLFLLGRFWWRSR